MLRCQSLKERMLASGFFRAKMAQENLIKASSIPYTIIRATQFFEFVKAIADLSTEATKFACQLRSSSRCRLTMLPAVGRMRRAEP